MTAHPAPRERPHWHDAYDAQMTLWRFLRSQVGMFWMEREYRRAAEGLNENTRRMLGDLWAGEPGRLLSADPFYVTADMCEVVEAAKETFVPEPLLPNDFLTPVGFCYYERPFVLDSKSVITSIGAFSWQPVIATGADEELRGLEKLPEGLVDLEEAGPYIEAWRSGKGGVAITLYASSRAPGAEDHEGYAMLEQRYGVQIWPMHATPWWFGMDYRGNEVDENLVATRAESWWKLLQTTLRLMQQRIAHRQVERPDRGARREARKLRLPDEREIVVVRLRREGHDEQPESQRDVPWTHRWITSGHWRNHWYPSEGVHRQIWISPYVKGPKDRPLIVRPRRVFQWER